MQDPSSSDTCYFPAASTYTTVLQTACEINCLHSQTLIALNLASVLLPWMSLPCFATQPTLLLTFEDAAQASLPPGRPPSYLLIHLPPNAGLDDIFWALRVSSADPAMVLVTCSPFLSAYKLSPLSLSPRHQGSAPWIVSKLINNLQMTAIPNNPNIQSLTFIKDLAQDLCARNHGQCSIPFGVSYLLAPSWKGIRLEKINYSYYQSTTLMFLFASNWDKYHNRLLLTFWQNHQQFLP